MSSSVEVDSALGVPSKKFGVVHPAQFFIPKHGTAYHDEILLKITRAWYSSLAWYTLCAENLTVLEKRVEPFFVVLIFFVFLVFPGFSSVQGLENGFVKICGTGTEMAAGELDSVLRLLLDAHLQLKPSWLACTPNVLFIAFAPNFSFIQVFKLQVAKIKRTTERSIFE